ncbi:TIGR03013 family XrtA/PEP-CTERM system glycosyltransferase [Thermodesulfobacteriota bacterium]
MPYIFKKYYPIRNIFFVLGEGILIFIAINIVFFILADYANDSSILIIITKALLVTIIFQICLYYFDMYDFRSIGSFSDNATRITQAFGSGCILLAGAYFFFPSTTISFGIFLISYVAICICIALWRFYYSQILKKKKFAQPILLIGTGNIAQAIAIEIMSKMDSGYYISACVGKKSPGFSYPKDVNYSDDYSAIPEITSHNKIESIVVALDDRRGQTPINELLNCKLDGVKITTGVEFYEELTGKILVNNVKPDWLIYSDGFQKGKITLLAKRLLDFFASLTGLILTLPIILLSGLVIKLESPGPVLYSQERVGEDGKTFWIYKFRSMYCDAESNGPVWAQENDCRVTRFGSFIRKTRIDEIPQLWNILKGEMSFVGPRPERPYFVEQLKTKLPYYSLRHNVKPGLSGWAQISYPYGASEEDALHKLEYDLYYIKNLCFRMDIMIALQTIKIILFQRGSR